MIRIIDNKKIDLTADEYKAYKDLCRSYDRPNFKGEELFKDHFIANNEGIIVFVKPPHKRYSSLEVFCFLISIMNNQHMRIHYEQVESLVKEAKAKLTGLIKENQDLKAANAALSKSKTTKSEKVE